MKIPQINRTILFFLLTGVIVPNFGDMGYYFALNIVEFSKFTVSMLSLIGFLALLLGTILYNRYFKAREIRQLLEWAIYLGFIGCATNLMFALRINLLLGISDLAFIISTSTVVDTFSLAFS